MNQRALHVLAVKLYLKPGCHLCEAAEAHLEAVRPRYPHMLERVDISTDPALLQRYGEQIPVLVVDGQEYAAPLGPELIERALKQASSGARADDRGPRTFPRISFWSNPRVRGR